jgi:hypothetical protein
MKKEATPKNAKGLVQKTSDEKRVTSKNAKGLIQKTSDEKRGNPEIREGDITTKLHEGDITTDSHKGDITTKSDEGNITTEPLEGEAKLHEGIILRQQQRAKLSFNMITIGFFLYNIPHTNKFM